MEPTKNRHLAAIMFTDIEGYTRLMQESESKASQLRSRHREVFEQSHEVFKGQILQYYGDGTLSIFDSCLEAVNCAIKIQQELQQIPIVPLRIGIHLGEIVRSENDIYGDGVNVASRVESLGKPGAIMISEDVHKFLKNQELDVISMGHFEMKNVSNPLEIFAVDAPGLVVPKGKELSGKAKRINPAINFAQRTGLWMRLVALGFVAMAFGALLFWTQIAGQNPIGKYSQEERLKWAYQTAIPKVEGLVDSLWKVHANAGMGEGAWQAYKLIQEVETIIPDDPKVKGLKNSCSFEVLIQSEPAGAKVFAKPYSQSDTAFEYIGETPLESIRLPGGNTSIRIEKKGYEIFEDFIWINDIWGGKWEFKLDKTGTIPDEMVMVRPVVDTAFLNWLRLAPIVHNPEAFLMDKYEVSNKEYKAFVNAGGYQNPKFWKEKFIRNGKTLGWEEAMVYLVDQTGRPGPSTWLAGDYPEGQDDYPVGGISWYEACAYAEYVGKQLPSNMHLKYVSGIWAIKEVFLKSNLQTSKTESRRYQDPQNRSGVYDLSGNVREWCYNMRNGELRSIVGGAYDDQDYLAANFSAARLPFDRSTANGFRCIKSLETTRYNHPFYAEIKWGFPDYSQSKPVSDDIFQVYLKQFNYDKGKLSSKLIYSRSEEQWVREKVEFNTPYGNGRMQAYLFLPKNVKPPYQTVIHWPGSGAGWYESSEDYIQLGSIDFLVKNGRAVLMPVFMGTYERREEQMTGCEDWRICLKDKNIKVIKDLQRSIDYLETREDINLDYLAYSGLSWGAVQGPLAMAVDNRIKAGILLYGGLPGYEQFDEMAVINYLPRVRVPVILFNGRYDFIFPLKESIQPFFDFIGTPKVDKKLVLYNDSHLVSSIEMIRESLLFLDKYFGKVERILE